jgi:hypothetical protein
MLKERGLSELWHFGLSECLLWNTCCLSPSILLVQSSHGFSAVSDIDVSHSLLIKQFVPCPPVCPSWPINKRFLSFPSCILCQKCQPTNPSNVCHLCPPFRHHFAWLLKHTILKINHLVLCPNLFAKWSLVFYSAAGKNGGMLQTNVYRDGCFSPQPERVCQWK